MQKNGRRGRWSCGEGVRSNLKGLTLKRIDARSNVNDSAKAVVLCEYVIHVVWISVLLLATTPSVQYETKRVSERSIWMLRSDALLRYSFFYSGDNDYRNSVVSFCNTAPLLISDFFSAPLANQKKARYNMTEQTKVVIFKEARAWLLPITRLSSSARRCWRKRDIVLSRWGWRKPP